MRREVEFCTEDGTRLRGFLHALDDGSVATGIVMAHGFSGVKEQIDHYAGYFAKAGFAVLVYDHRGFGASDGEPRLEVDPYRQICDWRDAITFAAGLPEIDADRGFGVWGSSYAGGLATVVGANDSRVRCVVSRIPNVSGHRNSREMFSVEQRQELRARLAADRTARLDAAAPAMIPVFSTDGAELCALPPAVDQDFVDFALETYPNWRNEVTLRSVEHLMEFEAAGWTPHVAPKPLMMIVGKRDDCTFPEIQLDVFETARGPKKLIVHPGGHYDTYAEHFKQTSRAARDWFVEHLGPA